MFSKKIPKDWSMLCPKMDNDQNPGGSLLGNIKQQQ